MSTTTPTADDEDEPVDEYEDYHAEAPPDFKLGERTLQAREHTPDHWKPDAYEMRRHFGIPKFDPHQYIEKHSGCDVYPDIIRHRRNPELVPTPKSCTVMFEGKKGSGKTTLRNFLVPRLLDDNDIRIVDRGRPEDSGWLRLRWWTTLWLPEHASVDATWVFEGDETQNRDSVDDLSDVVRDVRYYSNPKDLVQQLGETDVSSYHVVYPDPAFTGCEQLMRETPRTGQVLPYTPAWEAGEDESPTPLHQWWFAFWLAQLEHGSFDAFMLSMVDECHEIFPPNPPEDDHSTDKKLNLMQDIANSGRKRMLSFYFLTQYEQKVDYRVLEEVTHRVKLADGRPNPHKQSMRTIPQGWEMVPMPVDFMSQRPKGYALCYVEAAKEGFAEFRWKPLKEHPLDENRWLQVNLGKPTRRRGAAGGSREVASQ